MAAIASQLDHTRRAQADADAQPAPGPHGPRAAARSCEFQLITDRAGFDALEEEWNELFARAGRGTQVFQTFNWLWHWANHYLAAPDAAEQGPGLAVVTGRRDGRLVMVWPLVRMHDRGVVRLTWMGEPVSQYGDVLVDDMADTPVVLRAAWDFIVGHADADVIRLRKIRTDAAVAPLMAEIGAEVTEEATAPYLDLRAAGSFDTLEQRVSPSLRRNRKRQRRRLEDLGAVALECHTEGARARSLTVEAMRLKKIWLKRRGLVSPALADPRAQRFFEAVAEATSHPAGCHVLTLTANGTPAAIEVGVHCKDRTAIHVIVYDLAFERVAAGALLMQESISRAFDAGLACYDFLAPADPYKFEWADGIVSVRDWAVPLTLKGRLYASLYLGLVRSLAKRALTALPMVVRRHLANTLTFALVVL